MSDTKANRQFPDLLSGEQFRTGSPVDPKALISIRWFALLGQFSALVIVSGVLGFNTAFDQALSIILVGIIVNLFQSWRSFRQTRLRRREILLALIFDVLQLAALLYLTGGLVNPFAILFLAPIVVSAAVLDFKSTVMLIVVVVISACLLSQYFLPLPWYETGLVLPEIYVIGILSALIVSSMFIGFYVWWLAAEARRTNAVLSATQLMLEREQQTTALGALAAAAAHKLGSPLNTIAVISHDLPQRLQRTEKEASHDETITEDIIQLGIEAERCRVILSELNQDILTDRLNLDAARPVSDVIQSQLEQKILSLGRMLHLSAGALDGSPEPSIMPHSQLKYALETLLDNAHDFAFEQIVMDIGWTEAEIDISIEDDGPGFPPAILNKLGQPWNSSREGLSGHKGLGVFLAKTLIETLGGKMVVNNGQDRGAIIHIQIPIVNV